MFAQLVRYIWPYDGLVTIRGPPHNTPPHPTFTCMPLVDALIQEIDQPNDQPTKRNFLKGDHYCS